MLAFTYQLPTAWTAAETEDPMGYPIEHDAAGARFTSTIDGRVSLLQYRLRRGIMEIVHTEVPPELGGHGIAGDLMRAALAVARTSSWRVRPACSYAQSFLESHPEYADLLE
jgi:hypothetical protein